LGCLTSLRLILFLLFDFRPFNDPFYGIDGFHLNWLLGWELDLALLLMEGFDLLLFIGKRF
jgi:hypothetical protein